MDVKAKILKWWRVIDRPGIGGLCEWLMSSDFFVAPASTKHHLACVGGLAQHSLNVLDLLVEKSEYFVDKIEIPPITAIIVTALGHDLCKVNYYKEGGEQCSDSQFKFLSSLVSRYTCQNLGEMFCDRFINLSEGGLIRDIPKEQASILIDWLKNGAKGDMPDLPMTWSIDDQLPLGHGEKSLSILQDFIRLTDEEKTAIRWHMGSSEPGTNFFYPTGASFMTAKEKYPLVTLLACADQEAAFILEREPESEECTTSIQG